MSEIASILAIFTVNYWIYEHYRTKFRKSETRKSNDREIIMPDWIAPPKPPPPPPRLRNQYTQDEHFLKVSPPPVSARFRKRVMSYQCMDCDWGVRDIEQSLIIKQCPSCHASIMTGERKIKR